MFTVNTFKTRPAPLTGEANIFMSVYRHEFKHLSEAIVWKAGLQAIWPGDEPTIQDNDGYIVSEKLQAAFLANMAG